MPTLMSQLLLRYPLRWVTQSGLRSPYPAPAFTEASAPMIPLTRTASASRRKSTSPSIPLLCNNSNMSPYCLLPSSSSLHRSLTS